MFLPKSLYAQYLHMHYPELKSGALIQPKRKDLCISCTARKNNMFAKKSQKYSFST